MTRTRLGARVDGPPHEDGAPGDEDYCLEVLAPECPAGNAPAMRWARDDAAPLLMMRLIAYDYRSVDYRKSRTPAGTRLVLGDKYPEIAFAPDCSARCP